MVTATAQNRTLARNGTVDAALCPDLVGRLGFSCRARVSLRLETRGGFFEPQRDFTVNLAHPGTDFSDIDLSDRGTISDLVQHISDKGFVL